MSEIKSGEMKMTIRELYDAKAAKAKEAKALIDASDKENRDLTDEEQATFDALEKEITSLQARIDRKEKMDAMNMQNAREVPNANVQAAMEVADDARIEGGELAAAKDPNHGFASLGEFASIAKLAQRGQVQDERLNIGAAPTDYANETTDADGGYLIPPGFAATISQHMLDEGSFVPQLDTTPVTGNSMTFPKDEGTPWQTSGGVYADWVGEGAEINDTKPQFGSDTLTLNKVAALVPVTEELQSDQRALGRYLSNKMPGAIVWKVNDSIVNGDGTGKPTGFLNSGALVTIAKETGQAAQTVVLANIAKMYAAMPASSLRRAKWLINSEIIPQLVQMSVGNTPIYLPGGSVEGAPFGTLFGRPIEITECAQGLGSVGDISLVDFKQYNAINKGEVLDLASSMHLYFNYDMQAYRATFRIDGKSWASAPITPPNGTQQKSAFVTLAERA